MPRDQALSHKIVPEAQDFKAYLQASPDVRKHLGFN
jgi:hypothetical protein